MEGAGRCGEGGNGGVGRCHVNLRRVAVLEMDSWWWSKLMVFAGGRTGEEHLYSALSHGKRLWVRRLVFESLCIAREDDRHLKFIGT